MKEACSPYGDVEACVIDYASECALVRYPSIEEAIIAKSAFDRSPRICGVGVIVEFVSEADIKLVSEGLSKVSAADQADFSGTTSWYSGSVRDQTITNLSGAEQSTDTTIFNEEKSQESFPKWGSITSHSNPPFVQQSTSSQTSTPGSSSLWNDGGFLSGLTSPWHNNFNTPTPSSNVDGMTPSSGMSTNPTMSGGSSTMSTFLPNGLL